MERNIVVIFGGVSPEHDISIITAQQVIGVLKEENNVIPIYINKKGNWKTGEKLLDIENFKTDIGKLKSVTIMPFDNYVYKKSFNRFKRWKKIDCVVLALHGKNGEDGTVAAILELSNTPYINTSPLGSAVGCDKIIFKSFIKGIDIPFVKCYPLSSEEFYGANFDSEKAEIEKVIGYPLIIKPANLGSSIGINVCKNKKQLEEMLAQSFEFDNRVIIEKFIPNCKEVNVAIFKSRDGLVVSELEQPATSDEIFSFDEKYLGSSKSDYNDQRTANIERIMPPDIPNESYNQIVEYAKQCYQKLQLFGVVRFDFILDKEDIYLNEVNTIPGSYAFYLFKKRGINLSEVLECLFEEAIVRVAKKQNLISTFESSVLMGDFKSKAKTK